MPWLALLLVLIWVLERVGCFGRRRPGHAEPTPPPNAREAAQAWSAHAPAAHVSEPAPGAWATYVPSADEPDPEPGDDEPSGTDESYDDLPDRSNGLLSEGEDARPSRAYVDEPLRDEAETGQPLDNGVIIDPADRPREDPPDTAHLHD